MTIELTLLALSSLLGIIQLILSAQFANHQRGFTWAASARDEAAPQVTGVAGRLTRAFTNFMETFPIFMAAVLVAHLAGRHTTFTIVGAHLYFWARLAYVPLYAWGIQLIRSLTWAVATLGIILVLLGLLF